MNFNVIDGSYIIICGGGETDSKYQVFGNTNNDTSTNNLMLMIYSLVPTLQTQVIDSMLPDFEIDYNVSHFDSSSNILKIKLLNSGQINSIGWWPWLDQYKVGTDYHCVIPVTQDPELSSDYGDNLLAGTEIIVVIDDISNIYYPRLTNGESENSPYIGVMSNLTQINLVEDETNSHIINGASTDFLYEDDKNSRCKVMFNNYNYPALRTRTVSVEVL